MLKGGLTGGIGSGKSLAAEIFRQLGIPVYNADEEASRIREKDKTVKEKIQAAFGTLDRKALAGIVFSDPSKLKELNTIIHPAVKKHFEDWVLKQQGKPYVLKEAAILFESGSDEGLDFVIALTAPEELRIERVMKRDGMSREEVQARMKNQLPEEERNKRSGHILNNNEEQLLLPQVLKLHEKLKGK